MDMTQKPANRIIERAITAWRVSNFLKVFVVIAAVISFTELYVVVIYNWLFWVLVTGFLLLVLFYIIYVPNIRWSRWHYEISDGNIQLMHGILVVRHILIPVNRVQHVDTRQGPILRYFNLAAVTISTAATTHAIPALAEETAARVRDKIATVAGLSDDDV